MKYDGIKGQNNQQSAVALASNLENAFFIPWRDVEDTQIPGFLLFPDPIFQTVETELQQEQSAVVTIGQHGEEEQCGDQLEVEGKGLIIPHHRQESNC